MRTSVLVLLMIASLAVSVAEAGRPTPDLQPEPGFLATPQFLLDYHLAVRKVLGAEQAVGKPFAALVLPSFSSEWFILLHASENGFARIELRVVGGQVWGATQAGDPLPGSTSQAAVIDGAVAREAIAALERALRRTRVPPRDSSLGLDGTGYHFSSFVPREGHLSGHVWSPRPETDTGRLVELLGKLRQFVETPKEDGPANEAEIKALALQIAPENSAPAVEQGVEPALVRPSRPDKEMPGI